MTCYIFTAGGDVTQFALKVIYGILTHEQQLKTLQSEGDFNHFLQFQQNKPMQLNYSLRLKEKKSDFMNVFRIELQGDNATNLVASALP